MRTPTPLKLSTIVAAIVGSVAALTIVPASAATSIKAYTETLSVDGGPPATSVTVSTTGSHTFEFTLANATKSPQAFGSAEIAVPSGFTVTALHVLGSYSNFAANLDPTGGIIVLTSTGPTGSGVLPGHSLTIEATVTVSSSGACNALWSTGVKQSNDFSGSGNDFLGNSVTTTVGASHLVWTTQPGPTQYNEKMTPWPVVTAEDACGNPIVGTRTVKLADPRQNQLATGGSVTSATGVFTFSDLTFSTYDFDDTLVASSLPDLAPVESSLFTVYQLLKTCTPGTTCSSGSVNDTGKTTFTSVIADSAGTTDLLGLSVKGTASSDAFPVCASTFLTATGTPAVFYGSVVSLVVTNRGKTVTLTLPKTTVNAKPTANGVPFFDICLSIPADQQNGTNTFTDKFGHTGVYEGLLPDCASVAAGLPCVISRGKNAANEVIQFRLPPGDPHYGWG